MMRGSRSVVVLAIALGASAPALAADAASLRPPSGELVTAAEPPSRLLLENRLLFMGFMGAMASWLKPPTTPQGPYFVPSVELTRAESRPSDARSFAYDGALRLGVDLGYRVRRGDVELASGVGLREDWGFNVQGTTGSLAGFRDIQLARDAVPVVVVLNLLRVSWFF